MSNVYDNAHALEKAIRNSEEYETLKSLHAKVKDDESANEMFENFRNLQIELQQKQMQGVQLTPDEAEQAEKQLELVQQHELISELLNAEQRLSVVVQDVNDIITKPISELYSEGE